MTDDEIAEVVGRAQAKLDASTAGEAFDIRSLGVPTWTEAIVLALIWTLAEQVPGTSVHGLEVVWNGRLKPDLITTPDAKIAAKIIGEFSAYSYRVRQPALEIERAAALTTMKGVMHAMVDEVTELAHGDMAIWLMEAVAIARAILSAAPMTVRQVGRRDELMDAVRLVRMHGMRMEIESDRVLGAFTRSSEALQAAIDEPADEDDGTG